MPLRLLQGGAMGADREWNGTIAAIAGQNERIMAGLTEDIGDLGNHVERTVQVRVMGQLLKRGVSLILY